MLSSVDQSRSPRDLWGLPKIPQWPRHREDGSIYDIKESDLASGNEYHDSMIGIRIQGLAASKLQTRYDFDVQTSYLDIDCDYVDKFNPLLDPLSKNQSIFRGKLNTFRSFSPLIIVGESGWPDSSPADNLKPPYRFSYVKQMLNSELYIVNCSMKAVSVETTLRCGPGDIATSCKATRQRRISNPSDRPRLTKGNPDWVLGDVLAAWSEQSSQDYTAAASPVELHLMYGSNPYSGEPTKPWTEGDLSIVSSVFSRRMTTAFNTFLDSSLDPFTQTKLQFDRIPQQYEFSEITTERSGLPFVNSTTRKRTVTVNVYRANLLWIGILLFTTMVLEMLAICGLVLQTFIRGPDILGFASSMTRDNTYVPIPPEGSYLNGAERARRLKSLRLELSDIRREEEISYIAIRAVTSALGPHSSQEGDEENEKPVAWAPLSQKRTYT